MVFVKVKGSVPFLSLVVPVVGPILAWAFTDGGLSPACGGLNWVPAHRSIRRT